MKILSVCFVAVVLTLASGCAANQKCMREVQDLQAQSIRQDQQIRDLQGNLAVAKTEEAGTTFGALASEGWDAAKAAFGWAKAETPVAASQVNAAYDAVSQRLDRARKCYADHGGSDAHTYDEYKTIALACLNSN